MLCVGLVLIMFCDTPSPTSVSDYCDLMRPYVTLEKYKPGRTDGERSKRRYLSITKDFKRICTDKEQQHPR